MATRKMFHLDKSPLIFLAVFEISSALRVESSFLKILVKFQVVCCLDLIGKVASETIRLVDYD